MRRSILPDSNEIRLDKKLLEFFSNLKDDSVRMFKVVINEKKELELAKARDTKEGSDDWKVDYNQYVSLAVDASSPCFIFYRLDEKNKAGQHMWLFISWSPDCVSNKQRTIYALCKSSLINKFSGGQIKENLFISDRNELTLESYLEFSQIKSNILSNVK